MQYLTSPPTFRQQFYSLIGSVIRVLNFEYSVQVVIGTAIFFPVYHMFALIYFHMSDQYSDVQKPGLMNSFSSFLSLFSAVIRAAGEMKDIKFSTRNIGRFLFHLGCSVTCFILWQDEQYWPSFMGGNGSVNGIFEGFPNRSYLNHGQVFVIVNFFGLLIDCLLWKNIRIAFTAYMIWIMSMMNSTRVFIVLSFLVNTCNVWKSIDLMLSAKSPKLLKIISGILNIGLHVALKIIAFGVIMGHFWITPEDSGSWVIWLEMINLKMTLTCLWVYYAYHVKEMVANLKLRLERNGENEEINNQDN